MNNEEQLEGQMTIYDWLNIPKEEKSTIPNLPDDFMNPPEEE